MRITPWDTLELSGRIAIPTERVTDQAVCALLPEDYRPAAPRRLSVATDARTAVHAELTPTGEMTLRLPTGRTAKASWLNLDGLACRLDKPRDDS